MSAADRRVLIGLLDAVGFQDDDSTAYVGRLRGDQVAADLAWHDRERQWLSEGDPATWSPERKQAAQQHYLAGHGVSPTWYLSVYPGSRAPAAPPPTVSGGMVAGVAFVLLVGIGAWALGQR